MKAFQELGAEIERQWRRANYDEPALPQIATDALAAAALERHVDPWEIVRWIHTTAALPAQQDVESDFGDLAVTLFAGSRFYIDAYYWLDGTTTIHQHAFSGAFHMLLGSSVHSQYAFREDRIVSEHFAVGAIDLRSVELLKAGDTRPIRPGRAYIHSLFHLDRPSVTITVRSEHTPSAAAQYDYQRPHIALDSHYRNATMIKAVQSASLLLAVRHRDAEQLIADFVNSADFHTAYLVVSETFRQLTGSRLEALFGRSTGRERVNAILEGARRTHGDLVDVVLPVLDEQERQRNIFSRRAAITADDHRFLLALLLNVPDKRRMLDLVGARVPDRDPITTIVRWAGELSHTAVFGSHESNVLGIENFCDQHLQSLEQSLAGRVDSTAAPYIADLRASPLAPLVI